MDKGVRIPLNHGKYALVDAEDAAQIARHRWYASYDEARDGWIAKRGERLGSGRDMRVQSYQMHRVIMGAPPALGVTHLNGDTLDNRKMNLRLTTQQDRAARRRRNANNTSGYRGVALHKPTGKWRAYLTVEGDKRMLGYYATPEAAARVYDRVAWEVFGEFAYRNFPVGGPADDA